MPKTIKSALFILLILSLYPIMAFAKDVTLAWDPNTEADLVGYRLYAREQGETYNYNYPEWEGAVNNCTVTGFDEYESYYFVVRAVDNEGNESGDSNEVFIGADTGQSQLGSTLGNNAVADAGGGGCFISSVLGD